MAYEYDRFERDDRGGSFLMGLLAGTILGAGLGMLFAPKSGSELRSQLGDQAGRDPIGLGHHRPEGPEDEVRAFAQDLGLADRQRRRGCLDLGDPAWRADSVP